MNKLLEKAAKEQYTCQSFAEVMHMVTSSPPSAYALGRGFLNTAKVLTTLLQQH